MKTERKSYEFVDEIAARPMESDTGLYAVSARGHIYQWDEETGFIFSKDGDEEIIFCQDSGKPFTRVEAQRVLQAQLDWEKGLPQGYTGRIGFSWMPTPPLHTIRLGRR